MTMSIIKPVALTDAKLTSSTVPEADYPAWVAATSYTIGQRVIRVGTHRIYENTIAGVDATAPELAPTRWLEIAPTNRWAMFDQKVGTSTTLTSPLTVVVRPGSIGGLALMSLIGTQVDVTVKTSPGGTIIYSLVKVLDGTVVTDFFDWFYADYAQQTDLLLRDLPTQYPGCEVTVSITGSSAVACGICHFGAVSDVGQTLMGASVGITDYSVKNVDAFGNYNVVERAYSKRASMRVFTTKADFNRLFAFLASVRATPCIYIMTEASGLESTVIYGFFKSFSIDVEYASHHLCALEVEGLI